MRGRSAVLAAIGLTAVGCTSPGTGTTTSTTAVPTTTEVSVPAADLIVYSGRNENFVRPVVEAFTAATGIGVRVRYGDGTSDLAATILNEGETTNADIFWAQDPAWIGAIGDRGLLTTLPDEILALVDPAYRDADGRWVGVTARSRVFIYNTDLVSEEELPTGVHDLTDPTWRGRIGLAPSNSSFIAFVSAMELVEGPARTLGWLEAMAANDVRTYTGNGPIVRAVVAGDLPAGLVNHYYLLQTIANEGDVPAVNHVLMDGDAGSLVMATGVGVLEPSRNKEAAYEFIRFLLAAEPQTHFVENLFEYGLAASAPTPVGQVPLADLRGPAINLSDLADYLESSVTLITQAGLN